MNKYFLAIDIGASSGRHILGWIEDGILKTEEVYRFENNLVKQGDSFIWDIDNLETHVKCGIKECGKIGKIPQTIAIDTWGVDYVLLDENKKRLDPVFCYRDPRCLDIIDEVEKPFTPQGLYERTGIQRQSFNTIYQLYCDKLSGKMDKAEYFMMMPMYLSYCLCGEIANEYTEATTGGIINVETKTWDMDIIETLGYKKSLFGALLTPSARIGSFTDEMKEFAGFDSEVVCCASHDTGSAVAACPLQTDAMYVSSGTWSLIGTERDVPVLTVDARNAGFTNEGGVLYRYRFLKNYMGMWLLQNIRRNLNKSMTYDEMMYLAKDSGKYHYIDVNSQAFVAPDNMIDAIREYLGMPELDLGIVINSVYHSLAKAYTDAVAEVENISGREVSAINIVGGGCQDAYLNGLTAQYTGKKVYAGPVEATAIGNMVAQILYLNNDMTLGDARELVKDSFKIEEVK